MASKIYKKGVFLVIEDTVSGNLKEFNTADVQIVKRNANLDQYEVLVLGVSQLKAVLGDIKNEAGSTYSENDWDAFRFNSVGVASQGGSAASGVSYDGTTSGLAATDVQAAIDEVQANVDALPAAPTTTVVNISSAQILDMGTTPIELLPAPGAGKYYEFSGFCELQYGTTPYTFANDALMFGGADSYAGTLVDNQFLSQTSNKYVKFGNTDSFRVGITGMTNNVVSSFGSMNESIILTSYNGADPTLGDGTLRVIITYTTRTFGV